jgi:hypothetical protein
MLFNLNGNCKCGRITLSCIKMQRYFPRINIELIAWVAGLIYLAIIHPGKHLPDLCLAKIVGFSGCPGCGLGASISHLFHGEWQESWESHKLGGVVLLALVWRIIQLIKLFHIPLKPVK